MTAFVRMFVGAHLPLDVVGGLALGWTIGALVHLTFGTPRQAPDHDALLAAIQTVGDRPFDLRLLAVDARGSTPYVANTDWGARFVKVISTENRDADTLYKLYRFLAFRHRDDDAPYITDEGLADSVVDFGFAQSEASVGQRASDVAELLVATDAAWKKFNSTDWFASGGRTWSWALVALAFSAASYFAAAVPLSAASAVPLPYGRTVLTQLAASFANRLSVASVGGIGVNLRYLQRYGLDRTTAATTVATRRSEL